MRLPLLTIYVVFLVGHYTLADNNDTVVSSLTSTSEPNVNVTFVQNDADHTGFADEKLKQDPKNVIAFNQGATRTAFPVVSKIVTKSSSNDEHQLNHEDLTSSGLTPALRQLLQGSQTRRKPTSDKLHRHAEDSSLSGSNANYGSNAYQQGGYTGYPEAQGLRLNNYLGTMTRQYGKGPIRSQFGGYGTKFHSYGNSHKQYGSESTTNNNDWQNGAGIVNVQSSYGQSNGFMGGFNEGINYGQKNTVNAIDYGQTNYGSVNNNMGDNTVVVGNGFNTNDASSLNGGYETLSNMNGYTGMPTGTSGDYSNNFDTSPQTQWNGINYGVTDNGLDKSNNMGINYGTAVNYGTGATNFASGGDSKFSSTTNEQNYNGGVNYGTADFNYGASNGGFNSGAGNDNSNVGAAGNYNAAGGNSNYNGYNAKTQNGDNDSNDYGNGGDDSSSTNTNTFSANTNVGQQQFSGNEYSSMNNMGGNNYQTNSVGNGVDYTGTTFGSNGGNINDVTNNGYVASNNFGSNGGVNYGSNSYSSGNNDYGSSSSTQNMGTQTNQGYGTFTGSNNNNEYSSYGTNTDTSSTYNMGNTAYGANAYGINGVQSNSGVMTGGVSNNGYGTAASGGDESSNGGNGFSANGNGYTNDGGTNYGNNFGSNDKYANSNGNNYNSASGNGNMNMGNSYGATNANNNFGYTSNNGENTYGNSNNDYKSNNGMGNGGNDDENDEQDSSNFNNNNNNNNGEYSQGNAGDSSMTGFASSGGTSPQTYGLASNQQTFGSSSMISQQLYGTEQSANSPQTAYGQFGTSNGQQNAGLNQQINGYSQQQIPVQPSSPQQSYPMPNYLSAFPQPNTQNYVTLNSNIYGYGAASQAQQSQYPSAANYGPSLPNYSVSSPLSGMRFSSYGSATHNSHSVHSPPKTSNVYSVVAPLQPTAEQSDAKPETVAGSPPVPTVYKHGSNVYSTSYSENEETSFTGTEKIGDVYGDNYGHSEDTNIYAVSSSTTAPN